MTGCQAELTEEEMQVLYVNDTGEVLIDKTITTLKNGFFEMWLPRNETGVLTVTQGDMSATIELGTFEDDLTCIATMELN